MTSASIVPLSQGNSASFGIMMRWLSFLVFLVLLSSCSKRFETLPTEELNVGTDTWVNDVVMLHPDEIFACGGERMERGLAFKLESNGLWATTQFTHERNASCLAHYGQPEDSLWWVGGDMLFMYETTDWDDWDRRTFHGQVPEHEIHRPQIREMKFSGQEIWFVGGENLNEGVIYHSWDGGENWNFSVWDHELRDIEFFEDYTIVVGHGVILRSYQNEDFEILRTGDFFISAEFDDDGNLVIVTNQGSILRSTDFGESFEKILPAKPAQRSYLDLIVNDNQDFLACGANGLVSISSDGGLSWEHHTIDGNPPLNCVDYADGSYCFGSSEGRIFVTSQMN